MRYAARSSRPDAFLCGPLALALALAAAPAAAQAPDAQKLFREGVELIQKGKVAEAEQKLQASWDLYETYDTAANLAECEVKLGQRAEAAKHMDFAANHLPNHIADAIRADIKKRAAELRKDVGVVRVTVNTDGATVKVGAQTVGTSPLRGDAFVEPGEVTIVGLMTDGRRGETTAQVGKGEVKDVRIEIPAAAGALPTPPPPPVTPPPGGGDREPSSPLPPILIIGGGSLAAIGLGVGIVGVAVAGGKGSDADEQLATIIDAGGSCPAAAGCADVKAALADQSTFQDLGTVGFIGMGVGVATLTVGLILLATEDDAPTSAREPSRQSVQAAAAPTGSDLGGSLRVTF